MQLEQERRRSNGLAQALQRVKEQHFTTQQQVEQEEEYIANRLLKRLEALKREKQARLLLRDRKHYGPAHAPEGVG